MKFAVHMTNEAVADVDSIYHYIYRQSPSGAKSWFRALSQAKEDLEAGPERFALAPESEYLDVDLHEHFFRTRYGKQNYRLIYRVIDDTIHIVRVRSPGQDFVESL